MPDPSLPSGAEPAGTQLVEILIDEDLVSSANVRLAALLGDALELRPAQLVIDLAGCSYADALAVDVLLNAHRRAVRQGSRMTLRAPSERVQRLLRLTHVDNVFNITLAPTPAPPPARGPAAVGPTPP